MNGSTTLWLTIVALGAYHGINPAMGWPLAVARGLEQRRTSAVFATLMPLAGGHLLAMAVVLMPVASLAWLVAAGYWSQPVRLGAALLVLLFGIYKLIRPRHPRALARVRPSQIAWWSFLMANAHGAGLMLLPFMLGLCSAAAVDERSAGSDWLSAGHGAVMSAVMDTLARSNLATALAVSAVHTLAMLAAGSIAAWAVYRWLGLQALRSAWLNLDLAWGASLVVAGAAGIWAAA